MRFLWVRCSNLNRRDRCVIGDDVVFCAIGDGECLRNLLGIIEGYAANRIANPRDYDALDWSDVNAVVIRLQRCLRVKAECLDLKNTTVKADEQEPSKLLAVLPFIITVCRAILPVNYFGSIMNS